MEAGEKRKDAQLAREVEFSIPREMNEKQGVQLARDFVKKQFVDRGMVADLNVHWDKAKDGTPKPHAHVMLTMRDVGPEGFEKKNRDWNSTELLKDWREAWSAHVNERMAELGLEGRIDHRSYEAQGIGLEPQHKIGPAASRRPEQGLEAERIEDHTRIARENGEKIIADPNVALDAITRQPSDVHHPRSCDVRVPAQRRQGAVRSGDGGGARQSRAGRIREGRTRPGAVHQSRDMIAVENRLERAERRPGGARRDMASPIVIVTPRSTQPRAEGLSCLSEQRDAFDHVTGDSRVGIRCRLCRQRQIRDAGRRARGLGGAGLHGARRGVVRHRGREP